MSPARPTKHDLLPPGYAFVETVVDNRIAFSVVKVEDGASWTWPVIFERTGDGSPEWRAEVRREVIESMTNEPPSVRVENGELILILGGFDASVPVGYAFDGFRRSGRTYVVVSVPVDRDTDGQPYGVPKLAWSGIDCAQWRKDVAARVRSLPRLAEA